MQVKAGNIKSNPQQMDAMVRLERVSPVHSAAPVPHIANSHPIHCQDGGHKTVPGTRLSLLPWP